MKLKVFVLFLSLLLCFKTAAQSPSWTLQPSICMAQKIGDFCRLMLKVEVQNVPPENLCLYLDGQLLRCESTGIFQQRIEVRINHNAELQLKNAQQQTLLTKTLKIKYLDSSEIRRRVRLPWSLF